MSSSFVPLEGDPRGCQLCCQFSRFILKYFLLVEDTHPLCVSPRGGENEVVASSVSPPEGLQSGSFPGGGEKKELNLPGSCIYHHHALVY